MAPQKLTELIKEETSNRVTTKPTTLLEALWNYSATVSISEHPSCRFTPKINYILSSEHNANTNNHEIPTVEPADTLDTVGRGS